MVKAGEKTNIQDTTGWGLEMHRQGSGELESVTKTHVDYTCICSVFLSALASSPAVSETLENAALKRWCSSSSSMKVTGEIEIWKVMIPFVRLCGSSNAKLYQKWRCKMIKVENIVLKKRFTRFQTPGVSDLEGVYCIFMYSISELGCMTLDLISHISWHSGTYSFVCWT